MPIVVAALPAGGNLFASPPKNPGINEPLPSNLPPPLPLPDRRRRSPLPQKRPPRPPPADSSSRDGPRPPSPSPNPKSKPNPALKATHSRTKYYKPVSEGAVLAGDDSGRAVVVGSSGVSYRLPGAPFDFQFSYSEAPKAKPLAIREPAFLPFAPPTMNRPWTGKAPLLSKKDKERKKNIRLFEPLGQPEEEEEGTVEQGKVMQTARRVAHLGRYPKDGRSREEILGARLKRREIEALIKPYLSSNRQVNLGRDGLTHNMLELIHSHWRRQEVCKVRCRGVPTVDMDNICRHLEEKSGGKIIHRIGGVVYLFRGRNYDPCKRPRYPIMLWKPAAPVYPKLIQDAPEGLTKIEADEFREKGQSLLPICKLAKNGIYINLVEDVRDAFEGSELVKINCQGMEPSDYKKLGAKLKELVPCVLLSFDNEQILIWRGKDWKPRYQIPLSSEPKIHQAENDNLTNFSGTDQSGSFANESVAAQRILSPKLLSLWEHAIASYKALLLDDTALSPDSLLERVEEFESFSQAKEHSYHALILPGGKAGEATFGTESDSVYCNYDGTQLKGRDVGSEDHEYDYEDVSDKMDDDESSIPFGALPVDSIVEKLSED